AGNQTGDLGVVPGRKFREEGQNDKPGEVQEAGGDGGDGTQADSDEEPAHLEVGIRSPAATQEAGENVGCTPAAARPGAVIGVTDAPKVSSAERGSFSDPSQEASGEAPMGGNT
ncbi:hypothetical protein GOODEAATRI_015168, partial [Goodea atripinnis]